MHHPPLIFVLVLAIGWLFVSVINLSLSEDLEETGFSHRTSAVIILMDLLIIILLISSGTYNFLFTSLE